MEKFFHLKENGTTVSTEIVAGLTTFFAMSYIIVVNPQILHQTGMPWGGVFLATIIAAIIGTLVMGLFANVPYAQAAGMGLNAFFTYTVCFGLKFTWQETLCMVFLCGLINIIITVTKIRKMIIEAIPPMLQNAIGGGIGIFVAYVGMLNVNLVTFTPKDTKAAGKGLATGATPGLATLNTPTLWLFLIGLLFAIVFTVLKLKGGMLLTIVITAIIGIPMGLFMGRFKSRWPDKIGTAIIVLIQAVPAAVYYLYIQMYGTTALNVGLLFDASNWKYWVLPVCSMSLGNVAFYAMWLRRYMVDESNKDYVRLARAKGVSENNIALRHIFRNAMVPLVQYIPSAFLNTVVGSIYIESLYSIPGMGGLLVTCVQRHDNTMVQGIVLLYACVGIIGLILGDLLMVLIDPRISFGKKEGGR